MKPMALSTGLGEIMAPQTLVVPLLLTPEGRISVQPGALHGRSDAEQGIRFVQQREEVATAAPHRFIWIAVELDPAGQPVRYKGIAVSDVWIDQPRGVGYKVLAESVNRIAEAIRGGVNLEPLGPSDRALVARQLQELGEPMWQRSLPALRESLRG